MTFNSIEFLILFPVVLVLYYSLPYRLRWAHLLAGSLVFYLWLIPSYIWVAGYLILVSWGTSLLISRKEEGPRKRWLWVALVLTVLPLFLFKYLDFASDNLNVLAQFIGWNYSLQAFHWVLPLGISFQTFQALSYVVEVYHRRIEPERHVGIYSLYILFFPQLVAGPIERPQNLLPQFRMRKDFDESDFTEGMKILLWGFFKKVVVADRLSGLADEIYRTPTEFPTAYLLPATIAFTFQIYCDFSGYSDIARGVSRTFGIRLMNNFERPYFAKNPVDFWRRWHISLSTWFRDYVYIPLGGKRVSPLRHFANLLTVFVVSGLWHGANWTFVIWGAFHGAIIVAYLSVASSPVWEKIKPPQLVSILLTLCLISVSWVFFRANNVAEAVYILTHLFDFTTEGTILPVWGRATQMIAIAGVLTVIVGDFVLEAGKTDSITRMPTPLRWGMYWVAALCVMNLGTVSNATFIYFQF